MLVKSIFKSSNERAGMEGIIVEGRVSNTVLSIETSLTEGLLLVVLKIKWSGCQAWSYVKGVLTIFVQWSFYWKVQTAKVYLVKTPSNGYNNELRQP